MDQNVDSKWAENGPKVETERGMWEIEHVTFVEHRVYLYVCF